MNSSPFSNISRITPAYAGKSGAISDYIGYVKDHPRLCGEKGIKSLTGVRNSGSPPPMRGKVYDAIDTMRLMRITPAYAGKRSPVFFMVQRG